MVGVPRSTGCLTCRKRKIGCSRERPICSQCKSANRECLGYARQTIFLHNNRQYTIKDAKAVDKSDSADFTSNIQVPAPVKPRKPFSDPEFVSEFDGMQGYISCDSSDFSSRSPSVQVSEALFNENFVQDSNVTDWSGTIDFSSDIESLPPVGGREPSIGPENQVSLLSAFHRRQILSPFYEMSCSTQSPIGGLRSWVAIIPEIKQPEPCLELAVLALATSRMGNEYGDDRLAYESLKIYGQSLKQMQSALWDPKRMYSDHVFGACLLLTLYEVIECPSHSRVGYVSHHNGCARLVQLRGPKAHTQGLAHAIFLQFRYIATLESLVSKTTFLQKQEWKSIPWNIEPKSVLDGFLDVFLGGVSILWESEKLGIIKNPRDLMAVSVQLINKCWDFDLELEEFYQSLKVAYGKPLFWPVIASDNSPHADSLASTRFEFAELKIANTMMLYWATLTVLWSGMARMYNLVDEIAETIIPLAKSSSSVVGMSQIYQLLSLPERGHSQDFIVTAHKVCQSVEFCQTNPLSMRTIVAPLSMICDTLHPWKKYNEEINFAKEKLAIVQKNGMAIVPYLTDVKIL